MEGSASESETADVLVDAVFIAALTFGLRARGISVGPQEISACAALTLRAKRWQLDELQRILAPVLVRRNQDKTALEDALKALLPRPIVKTPPPIVDPSPDPSPPPSIPSALAPAFSERLRLALRAGFARLRERAGALDPPSIGLVIVSGLSVVALIASPFTFKPFDPCPPSGCSEGGFHVSAASAVSAAAAATIVTALALIVFAAYQRRRAARATAKAEAPHAPDPPASDGSLLRIGSIGGRPERFLRADMAIDIIEALGYRLGETDPDRLDVMATVASHSAGADAAELVFERRRELPTLLLLVDARSDARHWNTLPDEFELLLAARGVAVDRLDYYGTLFSRPPRRAGSATTAQLLDDRLDAPGWTVTVVFGEGRMLTARDVGMLRRTAENGPALFLDFEARSLWDERHRRIADAGAWFGPATGQALRDGFLRIFSPTQTVDTDFAPQSRSAKNWWPDEVDSLPDELRGWAGECALLQPISFALAEKLRARRPKLANDVLAFSQLSALDGAFVGPEGLQFEPHVRRALLNDFLSQRDANRIETIAFVEQEVQTVAGEGADAEWRRRATTAQLRLFSDRQQNESGFNELRNLLDLGVLKSDAIDELVGRFVAPSEGGEAEEPGTTRSLETLRLPYEPLSAASRLMIAQARGGADPTQYRSGEEIYSPARWSVATAQVRLRLANTTETHVCVAFVPRADSILVEGAYLPEQESTELICLNTISGVISKTTVRGGRGMMAIAISEAAAVAAVMTDATRVQLAPLASFANLRSTLSADTSHATQAERTILLQNRERILLDRSETADLPAVFALNPSADRVAMMGGATNQVHVADLSSDSTTPAEAKFEDPVGCLLFIDDRTLVVGAGKRLFSCMLTEPTFVSMQPLSDFPEAITSIQALQGDRASSPLLVATQDGRIHCTASARNPGASAVEVGQAHGVPVALAAAWPLEDRAAVTITREGDGGAEPHGISLVVTRADGALEILGLALTASGDFDPSFSAMSLKTWGTQDSATRRVLAISAGGHKIAVRSGDRLEIRPLTYELGAASAHDDTPRTPAE